MKTIKLILIAVTLLASNALKAQVSVNINIGAPPQWGPIKTPFGQTLYPFYRIFNPILL